LKVCDGAVDLVLFRKRDEAEGVSRTGVRWLGELALQKEVAWLGKELRLLARRLAADNDQGQRRAGSFGAALSELSLAPRGSGDSRPGGHWDPERLQTAGCQHVLDHLLRLECPLPLEESRFLEMLETARAQLPAVTYRLGELTQQIHALRRKVLQKPKPYPGLEKDVDRLVSADFLERTPHARLPHVLRYLRAIEVRAERAALNPAKDAEKARQLTPFAGWENRVPAVNREAFGWMLEEFRVSVFAQELGTDQPVSVQRLKALGGM
jgi:ATP-dependent helicase HrpA